MPGLIGLPWGDGSTTMMWFKSINKLSDRHRDGHLVEFVWRDYRPDHREMFRSNSIFGCTTFVVRRGCK